MKKYLSKILVATMILSSLPISNVSKASNDSIIYRSETKKIHFKKIKLL